MAPSCRKISCEDVLGGQNGGFQKLLGLSKSPLTARRPAKSPVPSVPPQFAPEPPVTVSGSVQGAERDLKPTEVLVVGQVLKFRVLEIGPDLCPRPSEFKTGRIVAINVPNITLEMSRPGADKELDFDPNEEFVVSRTQMIEPKVIDAM